MKRICCYCQTDMGEKCGKCGGLDIHVLPKHYASSDAVILNCRTCGNTWEKGSEPASHGICEPCLEKQGAENRKEEKTTCYEV